MKPPITQKMLIDWGGPQAMRDAESLVTRGLVREATYSPPFVRGTIEWNNRPFKSGFKILPDGTIESECPCWTNVERGLICSHVIALGLSLVRRAADPEREQKYQEELRRAERLATISEAEYLKRVPAKTPGSVPATLELAVHAGWLDEFRAGTLHLECAVCYAGNTVPLDAAPTDTSFAFSKQDESILFVLEDVSQGPARSSLPVNRSDFFNLLSLLPGKPLHRRGLRPLTVNATRLSTFFKMGLLPETGELVLSAHTEVPFLKAGEAPTYLVSGRQGWTFGAENLWPLDNVLPLPYHAIYDGPVTIDRRRVIPFLQYELAVISRTARIESDVTQDLFTVEPAAPRFRLLVQGSPASLAATLYARYNGIQVVAGKPDPQDRFALPDPGDVLRYTVRNPAAEKEALALAAQVGFTGEAGDTLSPIVGNRAVLNFLGTSLPALRRHAWQVDLEGRVSPLMESAGFVTPVVHVQEPSGTDWFDISFTYEETGGASLSPAEVQTAIQKGDFFLQKDGRTWFIDSEAIRSMTDIFSDCASSDSDEPGHFRMPSVYAPFVKSSLDALDGIDVEDCPAWRDRALRANRQAPWSPVPLPEPLNSILRPYQKDGVNWLHFLEAQGFCGLLADEMGLGKTVETLAWLTLARCKPQSSNLPALIVCPTSIVENWIEETARFAPHLKTAALSGTERHELWDRLEEFNIVVTSYALLRRDLERYLKYEFSVMILDEAQHIKNRSTQNAQAAKQIRAVHRLVLTGTPIENGVSDIWSIMDFLMPGYLGSHDSFRQTYEQPIGRAGIEGQEAQTRLRRKLHPFLLRRLKTEVAKDLPPKIERLASCDLTPDQKVVYTQLLESSRQKVSNLVRQKGFNGCRMEILTVLLRLRQVCCHLDLLQLPDLKPEAPSAKLDLFFELLDEAFDGGHRILVFSQFVSMLTIIRHELDSRKVSYCYLDGSTKDRMAVVHEFNSRRDIPLFLISLKAGGTGLNLTGADMVIHFDPWWNPAVEDQATDRAYRIGQKRTVYSVKLITKNTVEEKVLALQKRKKEIINAALQSDEGVIEKMTWDDIREVLDL